MATYMVYVPSGVGDPARRAERTVFVREGFSLAAFLLGPLYLLYRRLWLATLGWLALLALLAFVAHALSSPSWVGGPLVVLLALLTGLEAASLRQSALRGQNHDAAALVIAPRLEQAERAFFTGDGPLSPLPVRTLSPPSSARALTPAAEPMVIGSFPMAGEP